MYGMSKDSSFKMKLKTGRRVSLDPRGACGIPFFLEPFLPDPPGFGVSGDPQWFWGLRGSPVGHGADWIPVVKTDQKHTCSEILLGITWSRVREDLKVDDEEGDTHGEERREIPCTDQHA